MNSRRGSTTSPISVVKISSASSAWSTLHLEERADGRIERGLPELLGVHLAETLVALDREALAAERQDRLDQIEGAVDRPALVLALERAGLGEEGPACAPAPRRGAVPRGCGRSPGRAGAARAARPSCGGRRARLRHRHAPARRRDRSRSVGRRPAAPAPGSSVGSASAPSARPPSSARASISSTGWRRLKFDRDRGRCLRASRPRRPGPPPRPPDHRHRCRRR